MIQSTRNALLMGTLVLVSYVMGFTVGIIYERNKIRTEILEEEQQKVEKLNFEVEALQFKMGE